MSCKNHFLALTALIAIPSWLLASEPQQSTTESDARQQTEESLLFPNQQFGSSDEASFLTRGQSPYYYPQSTLRFGWWGIDSNGAQNKTGEWQDLGSSAFWDFDRLSSNGTSTLDLSATGTDNETTDLDLYYFSPGYFGNGFSVDVDYDRFIHRLDHKLLAGVPVADSVDPVNDRVVNDDLNVGEDYAFRVQEFEADFKGRISENVKWRLNLWGMRKSGERQASSHAHCFDVDPGEAVDTRCHIQSQRQRIDWTTLEIEPVIEARWGALTAEYSRTMRAFDQDDEFILRPFDNFGFNGDFVYAFVPDNFTQIDRIKFGLDITPDTDFYANLFRGDTENKFRDTHRGFYGFDMRATNRSIDGLALSTFAKWNTEETTLPDDFLNGGVAGGAPSPVFGEPVDPSTVIGGVAQRDIRFPVNRRRTSVGVDARWRLGRTKYSSRGLSVNGGYEYRELERDHVDYRVSTGAFLVQQDTYSHLFHVGTSRRWSPQFDTFIRYNLNFHRNPLLGVREHDELDPSGAPTETVTNTSLPENENLIEIGGTWTPAYNFLLSATFGLQTLHHDSIHAEFDETNYPIVFSAWYAPDDRWSFSGGYAYYTNFIDQDISIGFRTPAEGNEAFTTPWNFQGRAQMANFGASYRATDALKLVGDVEWMRGTNVFSATSAPGTDLSALPFFSDVIVETTRLSAGVDYWLSERIECYFRYNYFDYEDGSVGFNSGTAHMFLGGVAATF